MSNTGEVILLTGATGPLGQALAQRFLREPVELCLLVHRSQPRGIRSRRVTVFHGDITRPRLGLSMAQHRALAGSVTGILHGAARTEFMISRAEAERVNVDGARTVVAFAEQCAQLQKIGVLSTAYVAGRRTGRILEDELAHRQGFVNEYEASKYRMEQLLRARAGRLPIAVYRLSTIIGDARTGRVEHFGAVHRALRLLYRGLIPMVPGEDNSAIDLLSSDYAANAIFHLFNRNFRPGKTYHIVAGEENTLSLPEFLESTARLFSRFDRRWKRRAVTLPPVVSLETFRMLEESVSRTGNSFLEQIVRAMGTFAPQLSYPKSFDAQNARQDLQGSGIRGRPLASYYPRIIRYCLKTNWGSVDHAP